MTELADELKKLNELLQNGSLTNEEFATAKAHLLNPPSSTPNVQFSSVLEEQLADLQYHNEVARIDREWEMESQKYQIGRRSGGGFVPTISMGLFTAFVGGVFGVFLTAVALTIQSVTSRFGYETPTITLCETIFLLFGVVVTIVAVGTGLYRCVLAQNHKTAYQAYQSKRQSLSNPAKANPPPA